MAPERLLYGSCSNMVPCLTYAGRAPRRPRRSLFSPSLPPLSLCSRSLDSSDEAWIFISEEGATAKDWGRGGVVLSRLSKPRTRTSPAARLQILRLGLQRGRGKKHARALARVSFGDSSDLRTRELVTDN